MTTIETRDGRPVAFEHAVEMAEYLCALDFGLDLIAGEERATPQSVADLFCTCFLHWETDYRQQQGFTETSDLYPIFGGYLFADVPVLQRYRLLAGQEIRRHELIPAEDDEARTFYRNHVFIRCSQSLPTLFCDPVFYATLRKRAYATIRQHDRFTEGLHAAVEKLQTRLRNMELRIKNAYTSAVFDCVSEEINSHLSRFTDRKYGKGTIAINDTQRVILTLFLLHRLGLNNLRATHTATLMASLWGGAPEVYRKLIDKCHRGGPTCGYADIDNYTDSREMVASLLRRVDGRSDSREKIERFCREFTGAWDIAGLSMIAKREDIQPDN